MTEIALERDLFIGKGEDRECYLHPNDPSRCIKVTVSGDYQQHREQLKYFRRMAKRGVPMTHLAGFYGEVRTNLGKGLIFQTIRDRDGTVSKGLDYYLGTAGDASGRDMVARDKLSDGLKAAGHYLLEQQIVVRDLRASNFLVQKLSGDDVRLMLVDGVGNNEFIPVSDCFSALRKSKIKRNWNRFVWGLEKKYGLSACVLVYGGQG